MTNAHPSPDVAPGPASRRARIARRLVHEPLVRFLLLAGVLFLLQAIFASDRREVIVVDAATQGYLFERQAELLLRPLRDEEKQAIVRGFVEEEILVREAVRRGFTDSSRVRTLLLQNMRFFIAGDLPEPDEDTLRAFHAANPELFTSPPSLDLLQVVYAADSEVPDDVLARLNGGADPAGFGNADLPFGRQLFSVDQRRLVQLFGAQTARAALEAFATDGGWHGPFVTPAGSTHFLRVLKENPPELADFDAARDWISMKWLADESRALMDREIATMEPNYRVEIAPLPEAGNGD